MSLNDVNSAREDYMKVLDVLLQIFMRYIVWEY